jgi:hypothetical protein
MIWPLSDGGSGLADSTRFGAATAGLGTAMTAASIVPASRRSKRTENIGFTPRNTFHENRSTPRDISDCLLRASIAAGTYDRRASRETTFTGS